MIIHSGNRYAELQGYLLMGHSIDITHPEYLPATVRKKPDCIFYSRHIILEIQLPYHFIGVRVICLRGKPFYAFGEFITVLLPVRCPADGIQCPVVYRLQQVRPQ